ncbi:MAG: hypothetical protein N2504_06300 [candidate division WOR-3 bacterium]|nr:hypothetical protein [candidate division WOR-3 bacterium]MCX7948179.1 hypothetical protein [candidate division WOR-3 bacterium]MDW8151125.1 hypothetical protein [candidate division WOR-3 bacterium]
MKDRIKEIVKRCKDNYIKIDTKSNKIQVKRTAKLTVEFENLVKAYLGSMNFTRKDDLNF